MKKTNNKEKDSDNAEKGLRMFGVNPNKLPEDVMSFFNELDDFTDPYNTNYIGSRMSNKLNDLLEKYK